MLNVINLNNNFAANFVAAAEKIADRLENINRNLGKSYAEILAEAKKNPATSNMTLGEYRDYLTARLQSIPRHPSLFKDDDTVILSDAALAAMKDNPDYENRAVNRNGRSATFQFGETQDDYRGTMHSKPSTQINNEPTYWELRLKRLKKRLEMEQEFLMERQELIKAGEQLAARREAMLGTHERPQLPITGVPAELLLDLLG